jgi:hypothetical protein
MVSIYARGIQEDLHKLSQYLTVCFNHVMYIDFSLRRGDVDQCFTWQRRNEIEKKVIEKGEAHDLREVGFRPISGNIWAPIIILAIQKSRY